jgi:hypothetical protein
MHLRLRLVLLPFAVLAREHDAEYLLFPDEATPSSERSIESPSCAAERFPAGGLGGRDGGASSMRMA